MDVTAYGDAGAFLARVQAWLERDEVANGLMLGICLQLRAGRAQGAAPPYLAAVTQADTPVVAAVRTPPFNLVLSGDRGASESGPALAALAQAVHARYASLPGVLGPAELSEAFARSWTALTGQAQRAGMRQGIYALRQVRFPRDPGGRLRVAGEDDLELVTQWAIAFQREVFGEDHNPSDPRLVAQRGVAERRLYLWEDGRPVSMAAQARPTLHGICVDEVYTPPELRRRGYASACVAALSQALLDTGYQYCTLFTDLANRTSNDIYQAIGYRHVCEFAEVLFAP